MQKRAAQVKFDWEDVPGVLDKLQEEVAELRAALHSQSADEIRNEMGDVLFTCANLARHLDLDAEDTLRQSTAKFERRFHYMEMAAEAEGTTLSMMSEIQREHLWRRAKESLGNT